MNIKNKINNDDYKKEVINGAVSYVKLYKHKAVKYMSFIDLYWIREYLSYLYLHEFSHTNIAQCYKIRFTNVSSNVTHDHNTVPYNSEYYREDLIKKDKKKELYCCFSFPRYSTPLYKLCFYRDKDIMQIMIDLVSSIGMCHSLNIWHRDIKAANIMVTEDRRAILIDFTHAIRKRTDDITLDDQVCTYTYRAPEVYKYQADGKTQYNEKIDIWSLGMILFEMVSGDALYKLFNIEHEHEMKAFINSNYIAKLKRAYTKHKRTLFWNDQYWHWINRMLDRNPINRPSASELLLEMVKFTTENNINVKIPQYTTNLYIYDKFVPNIPQITYSKKLRNINVIAIDKLRLFTEILETRYELYTMAKIINLMILHHDITLEHMDNMIMGLILIISVGVYDMMYELVDSVNMVRLNCDTNINEENVSYAVRVIMEKYAHTIFLSPQYNFNKMNSKNINNER